MAEPVYPWQADAWARVLQTRAAGRLPHALLVGGPAGTGVRAFGETLARALLCEGEMSAAPCGDCRGCRLFAAGTHPDAVHVEPAEAGKAIGIDAIRALSERLALAATADVKVALIDPAEAMTTAAANSLLKTLEEPAGGSVLLLVSRRPARLPATVRSRCQRIVLALPSADVAGAWLGGQGVAEPERWLARAAGAPLEALRAANAEAGEVAAADAVAEALLAALERGVVPADGPGGGARLPLAATVPVLTATVEDLLRLQQAPAAAQLRRPDLRARMLPLARRLDARALFDYLDGLYRSIPGASSSLRADIQLQGLLADAAGIGAPTARSEGR